QLTFVPEDSKKAGATAVAKAPELTFTANSGQAVGVLPGKYKITAKISAYMGQMGAEDKRGQAFEIYNRSYEAMTTPLNFEVTAGGPINLTIDLDKGTVTKN